MFQNALSWALQVVEDTPEEALGNLKEAVELYLDNAKELGLIADVETALTSYCKFTSIIEVTA